MKHAIYHIAQHVRATTEFEREARASDEDARRSRECLAVLLIVLFVVAVTVACLVASHLSALS